MCRYVEATLEAVKNAATADDCRWSWCPMSGKLQIEPKEENNDDDVQVTTLDSEGPVGRGKAEDYCSILKRARQTTNKCEELISDSGHVSKHFVNDRRRLETSNDDVCKCAGRKILALAKSSLVSATIYKSLHCFGSVDSELYLL